MTTLSTTKTTRAYSVFVLSLCACFLFYKYILQVYPGVITDQLMHEYHLTGAGLGNLAATFYYSYMITQLFVGVLLDKYSARYLTALAIFCCGLGLLCFSQTHNLWVAGASRALMGFGVAFATVAYMKLAAVWFPPQRYAFVAGLLATAAMAGAVFGQTPLTLLVNTLGWRTSLLAVGVVGIVLAFLFITLVRDKKNLHTTSESPIVFSDILYVFKQKQNWLLTFYSGLAFSPVAVFGGLWGNPFLVEAYHVDKTMSATLVSLVFIGLGLGSPIIGMLSDYCNDRRHVMFFSTLLSCVCITLVLYCPSMPLVLLGAFLFLFGFGIGAFMLVFAMGKELNDIRLTATVIAMINASDAVLDAITEPGIGKLLDLTWSGGMENGIHHFSLSSYHIALSVLPMYLLVACFLLLKIHKPIKK